MKEYKIFQHPQGTIEAVKQGWSWPAFFFGCIWALVKKMTGLGIGVLAAFIVLGAISASAGGDAEQAIDGLTSLGGFVLAIVFGVNGNAWREKNLTARGFAYKTTVQAATPEGATALYPQKSAV
ncbi:hypothetical protein U14_01844 [Candidatus Moduliflexus flocculans]|uniref:DUF2628 domain-containing protein n=1 Tax=Candidatus Moduliflexus flocculans TaxID=1499966 RepID=A0A0S6VYN7_9BACT|nr:hypothetical protein U14_01844 [Candidatus Moduliflexus flocculans]